MRDETSLSKRVRILPIWNMLARLKGTPVYQTMDAQCTWGQTDTRRHENPRWSRNVASSDAVDAAWGTDWVYTNTDAQCSNSSFGRIPLQQWYNNPRKAETCLRVAREFGKTSGTCMKNLVNTFDICQIDELKDFCYGIHSIRAEIRRINAMANQYTNNYKNLYLPS